MAVPPRSRLRRVYRALLRLLPFDFRAEFGPDMEQAFCEEHKEVRAGRKPSETLRFWLRTIRDFTRTAPLEHWYLLRQDLRIGLRVLARERVSASAAILTLALAIGGTTILFSVAYGVLFKPLPWANSDRLVRVRDIRRGTREFQGMTNLSYLAWTSHATTIDDLAIWSSYENVLSIGDERRRVPVISMSPNLFSLLGVQPVLGRPLTPREWASGQDRAAILSYGLWRDQFAGRKDVIGRTFVIDTTRYTVVAVMPASFAFPDPAARVWIPLPPVQPVITRPGSFSRSIMGYNGVARLKPGYTVAQAATEATARIRHADPASLAAFSDDDRPLGVAVTPLLAAETADVRVPIIVFLVAVALLLVTATANVAGLQVARATARRREVAVRSALGAGAGRLSRQFLIEGLLVGLSGGACGCLLAAALCRVLPAMLPTAFPRVDNISINLPVIACALGLSLAASVGIGLLPALFARRLNIVEGLAELGHAFTGAPERSRLSTRRLLVAGQIAVACLLLLGAALLTRNFVGLMSADLGYDPHSVLTARIWLNVDMSGPQQSAFLNEFLQRARRMPGVVSAATALEVPLDSQDSMRSVLLPGTSARMPRGAGVEQRAAGARPIEVRGVRRVVSPGYFATLRTRLVEGRTFSDGDLRAAGDVVVVNRAFAARYFGGHAVGRHLSPPPGVRLAEVIGVVDDVRQRNVAEDPSPAVYEVYRQPVGGRFVITTAGVFVRTTQDPSTLVPRLRALVRQINPSLIVDRVQTLEDLRTANLRQPRFYAALLGGLAFCAIAIAGVGLFAAMAYSVTRRSKELGVRAALGARPWDIVGLVLRDALTTAVPGLALGMFAAFGLVRSLASFLYGMSAYDGPSFVLVPLAVLAAAVLASLVPARRAARVDPVQTLRC